MDNEKCRLLTFVASVPGTCHVSASPPPSIFPLASSTRNFITPTSPVLMLFWGTTSLSLYLPLNCLCLSIQSRCDYMGFCLSDRCQGHFILDTSTLSLRHERKKMEEKKRECAHTHTHTVWETTQCEQPTAAWCVVNRSVSGDSLGGRTVSAISARSCRRRTLVLRINTFGSCLNFYSSINKVTAAEGYLL